MGVGMGFIKVFFHRYIPEDIFNSSTTRWISLQNKLDSQAESIGCNYSCGV